MGKTLLGVKMFASVASWEPKCPFWGKKCVLKWPPGHRNVLFGAKYECSSTQLGAKIHAMKQPPLGRQNPHLKALLGAKMCAYMPFQGAKLSSWEPKKQCLSTLLGAKIHVRKSNTPGRQNPHLKNSLGSSSDFVGTKIPFFWIKK